MEIKLLFCSVLYGTTVGFVNSQSNHIISLLIFIQLSVLGYVLILMVNSRQNKHQMYKLVTQHIQ